MNLDIHWSSHYKQNKDFGLITSHALTKILGYADKSLPKSNLDVGCGTGQLTRELFHHGYRCVGIDGSSKAIEIAKTSTTRRGLKYMRLDVEKGDLSSLQGQPYSVVTCKLVLAFIGDKKLFLRKMRELTQSGGIFVVITPTYLSDSEATPIALKRSEITPLLKSTFGSISTFEIGNLSYYICR